MENNLKHNGISTMKNEKIKKSFLLLKTVNERVYKNINKKITLTLGGEKIEKFDKINQIMNASKSVRNIHPIHGKRLNLDGIESTDNNKEKKSNFTVYNNFNRTKEQKFPVIKLKTNHGLMLKGFKNQSYEINKRVNNKFALNNTNNKQMNKSNLNKTSSTGHFLKINKSVANLNINNSQNMPNLKSQSLLNTNNNIKIPKLKNKRNSNLKLYDINSHTQIMQNIFTTPRKNSNLIPRAMYINIFLQYGIDKKNHYFNSRNQNKKLTNYAIEPEKIENETIRDEIFKGKIAK